MYVVGSDCLYVDGGVGDFCVGLVGGLFWYVYGVFVGYCFV